MPGLFSILTNAGQALRAHTLAMNTVQQNLTNASTPGYARQAPILVDLAFRPTEGMTGGVLFAGTQDSRDPSLDESIRFQSSLSRRWLTVAGNMEQITAQLDAGGSSGQSTILRTLFSLAQSSSAATPTNDQRTLLLHQLELAASTFSDIAQGISSLRDGVISQSGIAVAKINSLSERIAASQPSDPVSEAGLDSLLRQLSELADITVSRTESGGLRVLLGGQVPLVSAGKAFSISLERTSEGKVKLMSGSGDSVTQSVTDGDLGGYLELLNVRFPEIIGDASRPGKLNSLVRQFADRVNSALGDPRVFVYNSASSLEAAESIRLNPSLTDETFRPTQAALQKLATLSSPTAGGVELGNLGFVEYFEQLASRYALDSGMAQDASARHVTLLEQAETLRTTVSGVDTAREAVELMQIQQNFQAITRLMSTVNEMVDSVLNLVR